MEVQYGTENDHKHLPRPVHPGRARISAHPQQKEVSKMSNTNEKITVLVVEPGKEPYEKEIAPDLASLQHEVGGYIQAVYPHDDPVAVICDEEGKLKGAH